MDKKNIWAKFVTPFSEKYLSLHGFLRNSELLHRIIWRFSVPNVAQIGYETGKIWV
jgi:hypothetical protein